MSDRALRSLERAAVAGELSDALAYVAAERRAGIDAGQEARGWTHVLRHVAAAGDALARRMTARDALTAAPGEAAPTWRASSVSTVGARLEVEYAQVAIVPGGTGEGSRAVHLMFRLADRQWHAQWGTARAVGLLDDVLASVADAAAVQKSMQDTKESW